MSQKANPMIFKLVDFEYNTLIKIYTRSLKKKLKIYKSRLY